MSFWDDLTPEYPGRSGARGSVFLLLEGASQDITSYHLTPNPQDTWQTGIFANILQTIRSHA